MWSLVKKLMTLAGDKAGSIKLSIATAFLYALFVALPYAAIYLFFSDLVIGQLTAQTVWISVVILSAALLGGVLMKLATYRLQAWSGNHVAARERLEIGDRLKRVPMGFFNEKSLGEITTVLTSDISYYENQAVVILDKIINGTINVLFSSVFLMFFDWRFGLIFLGSFFVALVVMNVIQRQSAKIVPARKRAETGAVSATLEFVRGISVFKLFHMSGKSIEAIKGSYKAYSDKSSELEASLTTWDMILQVILKLAVGFVILLASVLVLNGSIDLPVGIVMILASIQIFGAIDTLASSSSVTRAMELTVNRMNEVKAFPMIDTDNAAVKLNSYHIEFDRVSFSYSEDDAVIKDVSFTIPQNTVTAFVGTSGSGKTTIARLIARFWDVTQGSIRIGGEDIREITTDSLLDNMSIVFQNVYLFNDSIAANIRYGKPDATQTEVEEAAKKARAHEFIAALPDGYDTVVGESGSHLSGGEKQRISIARAILKNAPIVLLDEATSSIDPDNEVYIQQAINELVKDKTLIVIAHRLTTVKDADQIIVMDNGKITQRGKHQELIASDGQYQRYWAIGQQTSRWKIATE